MARTARLLVTAFEPFGGRSTNRSWEVVRRISRRRGLTIRCLPVDFARLQEVVPQMMRSRPDALLLVGESPAASVRVEQVALNIIDTDRPDNAGARPQAAAIMARGKLALEARWNARAIARRLNDQGIAAAASFHAGTFACNAALYLALHAASGRIPVGFLHVPARRGPKGLSMRHLVQAVDIALDALVETTPHR